MRAGTKRNVSFGACSSGGRRLTRDAIALLCLNLPLLCQFSLTAWPSSSSSSSPSSPSSFTSLLPRRSKHIFFRCRPRGKLCLPLPLLLLLVHSRLISSSFSPTCSRPRRHFCCVACSALFFFFILFPPDRFVVSRTRTKKFSFAHFKRKHDGLYSNFGFEP